MAITTTVAKSTDGTIQITFTLPFDLIKDARDKVIVEFAKEAEIPGFRKGKAPLDKIKEKINPQTLLEKSLKLILPKALGEAITEHKIKPAIYPKFEIISAKENEDWQVRAVTCELPEIILGDYKQTLTGAGKAKTIWTPQKGKPDEKPKEPSREEKEQEIMKVLLETIKVNIPKILSDEEVNSRLASLLARIEKLGLTLEGYLASLGKTPESLRDEYETQAKNALCLDLILNKICEEEKIQVTEEEIDGALKAAASDPKLYEKLNTPEQRLLIKSVLARRQALDLLVSMG
jgi:FKBP-type peptidyl-prolyl cis-trans isomerase (trigger factor)